MHKKLLFMITVLMLWAASAVLFAGGIQEEDPAPEQGSPEAEDSAAISASEGASSITVTDVLGREVTIEQPVQSVVSLMGPANEAIKILKSWDIVTGRDEWTQDTLMYPNLENIPVLYESNQVNYELLFQLDPDVLFLSAAQGVDFQGIVDKVGEEIPVVVFDFLNTETLNENMDLMARVLSKEDAANKYKAFNDEVFGIIEQRLQGIDEEQKPRVFLKSNGWTADQLCTMTNKSSFGYSQVVLPGGINIAGDLPGEWIEEVDPEWLVAQDPEVILCATAAYFFPGLWGYDVDSAEIAEREREKVMSMDVFKNSKAVKNGRVYMYDPSMATSCMASVILLEVAKFLHPDLFSDIDPQAYHQQYVNEFIDLDIDLSQKGLFHYPDFD